jgi:transposase
MKFIRYGNLKAQKHDVEGDSFHTAPTKYGIYAFPIGYIEEFLIGGIGRGGIKNGRYRFLRDNNKKKFFCSCKEIMEKIKSKQIYLEYKKTTLNPVERDWKDELYSYPKDYTDDKKYYWLVENKPITFEYKGNVWCHFEDYVKRNEILKTSGSWILIDINLYKKILRKVTNIYKFGVYVGYSKETMKLSTTIEGFPISSFDKDDFEVFIEDVHK